VPRRRRDPDVPAAQERFAWPDVARVLAEAPAGEVVYEAPELRPRARRAKAAAPASKTLGLPFGVKDTDGRQVCWSCAKDLDEAGVVRAGPGDSRCGGCGAKLPFTE
jgi:hypothetical protein